MTALPKEVRLFAYGPVETDKGTFVFDKADGVRVMSAYADRGVLLPFDYEHKSLHPEAPAGSGKAAGWFRLELRSDGLYAVGIEWTPAAAEALAAKEWRYISPAFDTEKRGGEEHVTFLQNVALTNIPATHGIPVLLSRTITMEKPNTMDDSVVDPTAEPTVEPTGDTDRDALATVLDAIAEIKATLAALAEVVKNGIAAAEAEHEVEGVPEVQSDEALSAPAADEADEKDSEKRLDALPDAFNSDACGPGPSKKLSANKSRAVLAALVAATGTENPDEQIGALHALVAHRDQSKKLSAVVSKSKSNEHSALVEQGLKAGKLSPAQKSWALSVSSTTLRKYLSDAPALFAVAKPDESAVQPRLGGETVKLSSGRSAHLSADELKIAEAFGYSPKEAAEKIFGAK